MCTIIMFVTFVLSATLMGTTFAGYAGSDSNSVGNGNGYGYGYSGSFSGDSGNIPAPPIPNFDFGSLFNGYFDSLKKYHEHFINNKGVYSYALTSASPNANVQAQSSITFVAKPTGLQQQLQQQQQQIQQQVQQHAALASRGGFAAPAGGGATGGSYGSGFGGSFSGTDGSSVASAGIGPQGGYQSAAVYPENPNNPNIFSRFGEESGAQGGGGGGGGSYGVFTSSVSSNVNGKPYHQASTTINDNGKISTHTVRNP